MPDQQEGIERQGIDERNLAKYIEKDELTTIGANCVDEYNADTASRTDFDERRAEWRKLFAGYRDPKSFPWDDCANTHLPMLSVACMQFSSRAYEALIPPKELVKGFSTDAQSFHAARRIEKHMNWQCYHQMEEWEEDMDILLLQLPLDGSVFKKTYYDELLGRNVSKTLSVDEFITPYGYRRFDDVPRKTHVINMHVNDIRVKGEAGIFINYEDLDKGNTDNVNQNSTDFKGAIDDITGQETPDTRYIDTRIILEQHKLLDINYDIVEKKIKAKDGILRPYIVWVDLETNKVLRIASRQYIDPFTQKMETMEYFTQYLFIPNPDSHMGFGFGHLVDSINETADTIVNQLIDAGTLSNTRGGFIAKRSGLKRGDISFGMGNYKEVDIFGEDIRKAVYDFDFKPPSSVLFTMLGMLNDYVKEMTSTADWMMGQLPPSDTAATTMLAVIEQGLKVFSTIQKRCHRSLRKELKKLFILNRFYLDEEEYFTVQDTQSDEFKTLKIGRMDYMNSIDVIPVSDPNITSRAERLLKAQQTLAEVKTNPLMAQNPESLYYATREYLKTLEVQDVDAILKKPQPPTPPDLPPQEENAMALKEMKSIALPQQDHDNHIMQHRAFLASIWEQELTPQGKNVLDAHIKEHLAFLYLQMEQQKRMADIQMAMNGMLPQIGGVNANEGQPANNGGAEGMGGESVNEQIYSRIGNMAGGIKGGVS